MDGGSNDEEIKKKNMGVMEGRKEENIGTIYYRREEGRFIKVRKDIDPKKMLV